VGLQVSNTTDWRLEPVDWSPEVGRARGLALRLLFVLDVVLAIRYLAWLLQPGRPGQPVLYGMLVAAEVFNLVQGVGFWWTTSRLGGRARATSTPVSTAVDVLIPTYNEDVDIVEPTVAAAAALRGPDVRVALLDDGDRPEMAGLARRYGVAYVARPTHEGAKAGNINHSLARTDAPFVAILDCDHVPRPDFLEVCLAAFSDESVAFVQTPQYYANWRDGGVAAVSWSQQALFFGPIAEGRDARGAMFCCGTNVVFRRAALDDVGGFDPDSLTEDFELSIRLHERGWTSRYVPQVLAAGLGPEDMGSYTTQQLRWARGCLAALPAVLRARLGMRIRLQYLLSVAFWLTGWTFAVYAAFPLVRIVTGEQPIEVASPEEFFIYWGPYFLASMVTVAVAGAGRYSYWAFALMSASFWIHILALSLTVLRRRGSFVVTPKKGAAERQVRPVLVPLALIAILAAVATYGLAVDPSPANITNATFASVHVVVLASGIRFAMQRPRPPRADRPGRLVDASDDWELVR
jgi:cellulose synthase (UDP-forming)